MKRLIFILALGLINATMQAALPASRPEARHGEFQFSVTFDNHGVDGTPARICTAYLWIPPNVQKLRGLIVTQQNVGEQPFTEHPAIREACARNGLAIVWCHPAIDIRFEHKREEAVRLLEEVLTKLGEVSGYGEIAVVPWFTFGHSTTTTFARNLAEARPERTIAIISAKGGIMMPVSGSFPGVYSGGHYPEWRQPTHDWTKQGRSLPGLVTIRNELRVRWRPLSYVEEFGGGHFDYTEKYLEFLALYIDKAMRYRLDANGRVREISDNEGYVVDVRPPLPTHPLTIAPLAGATGELRNAPWFFDRELAEAAVALMDDGRWARRNQIVAFANLDGTPAAFYKSGIVDPVPYELADDGVTVKRIETTFLDRLPDNFTQAGMELTHATTGPRTIERISGIFAVSDGAYRIELNRGYPDTPNFIAVRHPGDAGHRPSLQPGRFVPPSFDGRAQQIAFDAIGDQPMGTKAVTLKATSSAGLKVRFFVRAGPAKIVGDQLEFLLLPPRARLPVAVTVVAWQLGRGGNDSVSAAPLVEQTFHLAGSVADRAPAASVEAASVAEIIQLSLAVRDDAGAALSARVLVRDEAGRSYVPPVATSVNIGPDHWFACEGAVRLDVPRGRYRIDVERGPAYVPASVRVDARVRTSREIRLHRWIDMRARGYRSGENHLHVPPAMLGTWMAAEDLDFGSSLQWWNGPKFPVASPALSDPSVTLYDAEIENAWGAVYCIGLSQPMGVAWNPARSNLGFLQAARADGALIAYQGGWSAEVLIDALLGYVDVVNIADNLFQRHKFMPRARYSNVVGAVGFPSYPATDEGMLALCTDSYYRLLNCGLRLAAGGGSATGVKSSPAGYNRAYVRVRDGANVRDFIEAWRQGRNFVTNGPMLFLTANGAEPGDTIEFPATGGEVRVRVEALSSVPLRTVKLIVNGESVASSSTGTIDTVIAMKEGSWMAAVATSEETGEPDDLMRYRQASALGGEEPSRLRFAHTSPIYVTVGGAGARVKRSLQETTRWLDAFEVFAEKTAAPEHRKEIEEALVRARANLQ